MWRIAFINLILITIEINAINKLPSYIVPCKRSDPNINACALQHGKNALPYILKGDSAYRFPVLTPLHIESIDEISGGTLSIKVNDCDLYGLETADLKLFEVDMNKHHIKATASFAKATLICHYIMKGQILVLPIEGDGRGNITVVDAIFTYETDFKLITKKGLEYAQLTDNHVYFNTSRGYMHFDNLFNGNEQLGQETNQFLYDNWQEVFTEFDKPITETVSSVLTLILKSLFENVPFNEIFSN